MQIKHMKKKTLGNGSLHNCDSVTRVLVTQRYIIVSVQKAGPYSHPPF